MVIMTPKHVTRSRCVEIGQGGGDIACNSTSISRKINIISSHIISRLLHSRYRTLCITDYTRQDMYTCVLFVQTLVEK